MAGERVASIAIFNYIIYINIHPSHGLYAVPAPWAFATVRTDNRMLTATLSMQVSASLPLMKVGLAISLMSP